MRDDRPALTGREDRRIVFGPARQFATLAHMAVEPEHLERMLGLM